MVFQFGAVQGLALFGGVILPLISALVTRAHASAATRAAVLLGLSGLTSFSASWLASAGMAKQFDIVSACLIALGTFAVGALTNLVSAVTPNVQQRGGIIGRRQPPEGPIR